MIEPGPVTQGPAQGIPVSGAVFAGQSRIFGRKRRQKKNLRSGEIAALWFSRLFVWLFIFVIMIPIAWIVGQSFQPGLIYTPSIIPSGFTWAHYQTVLFPSNQFGAPAFYTWVRNSTVICTSVGVATVILVATMAYAFARFRFVGRKYGLMALLLIQMFPAQMAAVAFLRLEYRVNAYDTLWGVILVFIGAGLPFSAWLFKGYVDSLPRDLEEAAYVDGASRFQAYWKIILPLTRPMMAVVFLFSWFGLYSEYLLTSILLPSADNWTVALGLRNFISGGFLNDWTTFAAGAVVGAVPVTLVFIFMQRFLVSGLARGAVKG
jgi:arabinogalactan oligomer / maltooligosaccharide transport system permease protein